MNVLDLFSGIGGFSFGLERAGMRTVAFCEIDPFCRQVLRKHWPDVPIFEDIRDLTADDITESVDVICGGFPCQDISFQGLQQGLAGTRSGLWSEITRLVGEIRPKYLLVENVTALLHFEFEQVLGDLAALRYDAEWECIPAAYVGASHLRDRLWLVAYPSEVTATATQQGGIPQVDSRSASGRGAYRDAAFCQHEGRATAWMGNQPAICRTNDGLSYGVAQREWGAAGNGVVPQIPEMIGRAILQTASGEEAA